MCENLFFSEKLSQIDFKLKSRSGHFQFEPLSVNVYFQVVQIGSVLALNKIKFMNYFALVDLKILSGELNFKK